MGSFLKLPLKRGITFYKLIRKLLLQRINHGGDFGEGFFSDQLAVLKILIAGVDDGMNGHHAGLVKQHID